MTGVPSRDVEVLDLQSGTSALVASMIDPRASHAAARLSDGTVLLVGGYAMDGVALATAEISDPTTATPSPAGSLGTPRHGITATTLLDGRVLVAGGNSGAGAPDLATAEIYDPFAMTFAPVPTQMSLARAGHSAILLPHNAGVLIAGGSDAGGPTTVVDLFVPAILPYLYTYGVGNFVTTGSMTAARAQAVSGPAGDNGYAFVAGGGSGNAEAYRFATIRTDKDDYAPGQLAVISGTGWQPGEQVALLFQEDPPVHPDYAFSVTAESGWQHLLEPVGS